MHHVYMTRIAIAAGGLLVLACLVFAAVMN